MSCGTEVVKVPLSLGIHSRRWRYLWNILIVKIRAEFIFSGNILNVNESTPTFGIEVTYRRMAQVTMLRSTGSSLRTYRSSMMEFATLFQVGTVGFEKKLSMQRLVSFWFFDWDNRVNCYFVIVGDWWSISVPEWGGVWVELGGEHCKDGGVENRVTVYLSWLILWFTSEVFWFHKVLFYHQTV